MFFSLTGTFLREELLVILGSLLAGFRVMRMKVVALGTMTRDDRLEGHPAPPPRSATGA